MKDIFPGRVGYGAFAGKRNSSEPADSELFCSVSVVVR